MHIAIVCRVVGMLRRVHATLNSCFVNISGVNVEKFDDKYFGKAVEKKKKKGEGEFFEAEKEVSLINSSFIIS
ncbi:putative 60S ribosomal protein L6E [Rosa chinensis]|uniref:Putative 60S ribosomal protein L6E n=1 Tax=Rosa chinensis TaxID=74649 RepID=A0A2P6S256_ROSCH|nr:putative 60S ribosomal protein L6E [Rosa chinensis]